MIDKFKSISEDKPLDTVTHSMKFKDDEGIVHTLEWDFSKESPEHTKSFENLFSGLLI